MSFGCSIFDIIHTTQLAFEIYAKLKSSSERASGDFENLLLEIHHTKEALLAINHLVFSNSRESTQDNKPLETTFPDCDTILKRPMKELRGAQDIILEKQILLNLKTRVFRRDTKRLKGDWVPHVWKCGPQVSSDDPVFSPIIGEGSFNCWVKHSKLMRPLCLDWDHEEPCQFAIKTMPNDGRSFENEKLAMTSLRKAQSSYNNLYSPMVSSEAKDHCSPDPNLRKLLYRKLGDLWSHNPPQFYALLLSSPIERFTRSLQKSKLLTILSPILFASSASARIPYCGDQENQVHFQPKSHDQVSWIQALHGIQRDLLSVSPLSLPSLPVA